MSRVKVPLFSKPDTEQFGIPVDFPDIAFLRKLSVAGRLRYPRGTGIAPITITPTEGETFFILSTLYNSGSVAANFTLTNDGNVRESISITANTVVPSNVKMDSLVGNGIKTITVTTSQASAGVNMTGWVENTSRIRDVTI